MEVAAEINNSIDVSIEVNRVAYVTTGGGGSCLAFSGINGGDPDSAYSDDCAPTTIDTGELIFVASKDDLPDAVVGVITLGDNVTYYFLTVVDLLGDRIVCGQNTVIMGASSENCRIKSTGLGATALITSVYSLPIRFITIEAELALDLNGDGVTTALDWIGVNFTDCANVGTIANYSNFIMADSAFLNSGGLTFDGTIGTIGFSQCLFNCNASNFVFTLPSTLTITRRFRIIYSSFVVLGFLGETGVDVDPLATIPTEGFILDTVNFAGGGTYLNGIDHTSNDALFINCTNITNTASNGQLYMLNNAVPTPIALTNTFYKVEGVTLPSVDNSKFTVSNDRLTCDAAIRRRYVIQATISFTSGNNNECEFGFYDSQLATIRTPSRHITTANAAGRAENATMFCILDMQQGDYIEVHCANNTATTDIVVVDLNLMAYQI